MKKTTKVIQFADEGRLSRIQDGYYGSDVDWNPNKEIELYQIKDISKLESQGIILNDRPNLEEMGMSTFVQSPLDKNRFISIKKFGTTVVDNREQQLTIILGLLGIHEYYIKTYFKLEAGFGKDSKSEVNAKAGFGSLFSGKAKAKKEHTLGVDISGEYVKAKHDSLSTTYKPTMEKWLEAVNRAQKAGIYDSIEDIIMLRKPGENEFENPSMQYRRIDKRFDAGINVNLSAASALSCLSCYNGFGLSGAANSLFNFNLSLHGYYETTIIYNFGKEKRPEIEKAYREYEEARIEYDNEKK